MLLEIFSYEFEEFNKNENLVLKRKLVFSFFFGGWGQMLKLS